MEAFFSKEVLAGLEKARLEKLKRSSRLVIEVEGKRLPVLHMWNTGFAMDPEEAPKLRGLVDLYEGPKHLFQCLIVASDEEEGEIRFEFKRATAISDAPALDFAQRSDAPVALIRDAS